METIFERLTMYGNIDTFIKGVIQFYLVMLIINVAYIVSRPNDRERLRFAILMLFYIVYNLLSAYLPDQRAKINYDIQVMLIYGFTIIMAYYLTYYTYKLLQIKRLYKLLILAPVFTLVAPYVLLFLAPFMATKSKLMAGQLISIVPGIYVIYALYKINRTVKNTYVGKIMEIKHMGLKVITANLGILAHLGLVTAQFFYNGPVGVLFANCGFIIISLIFLYIMIIDNQKDYYILQQSENQLQEYNHILESKVLLRTKEIELLNKQRTDTFLRLAHETRTPITLIKNNLDEITISKDTEKEIENIKKNLNSLNEQISNILDIENAVNGNLKYDHNTIIDLSVFVENKVLSFKKYSEKKNITLNKEIEKGIKIKASVQAIDSLLNNLIENAIKYTQEGGNIMAKLFSRGGDIILNVKDNGYGIEQEFKNKIFEPYFCIPKNGQGARGIGIGLSIVKNVVISLNGEIELKSKVGKGSEFIIKLKKYIGNRPVSVEIESVISDKTFYKDGEIEDVVQGGTFPSILIVEDNVDLLRYVRDKLKGDYNIYVAQNGVKALKKYADNKEKIDLILSDIMMEGMDGIKFYQKLKENQQVSAPIIYVTAKGSAMDKNKALQMGAIDYIFKPFEIDEVKAKVATIIKNSINQRQKVLSSIQDIISGQKEMYVPENGKPNEGFEQKCLYYNISEREKEILLLLKQGWTYKEIAGKLFISKKTVDAHLSKIRSRIGVKNKQGLLNVFYKTT